ncbi:MAG: HAMP domain-containing protein [Chitinivibrionales bacterium]|nr:HAMP domain-containing protein [Chitinivibrionales bacterium]
MKFRIRLTLWYFLILSVVYFLLWMFFFFAFRQMTNTHVDRDLTGRLEAVRNVMTNFQWSDRQLFEEMKHAAYFSGGLMVSIHTHDTIVVESESWRSVFGRFEVPKENVGYEFKSNERIFRVMKRALKSGQQHFSIHCGIEITHLKKDIALYQSFAIFMLILSLLLAGFGGRFLTNKFLSPLRYIITLANEISGDDLSKRLPLPRTQDEISELATVINSLLCRLEDSFYRLRRFTSDASHELRTPLAALASLGEVALNRKESTVREYRDTISSILEEAGRLSELVDTLLFLTRADNNRLEVKKESSDFGQQVEEAISVVKILADEKKVTIKTVIAKDLTIFCDKVLLQHAVLNLLDNAIKYSKPGDCIQVNVDDLDETHRFCSIADQGPGIAAQEQRLIFDRFYRCDPGRTKQKGGFGLGLSIALWAVERNCGTITVQSKPGKGSVFTIIIPKN